MNPTLTKNYVAGATITKRRIVKFDSADGQVIQGAAATDLLVGVADELGAASGARVDVHHAGIVEVEFGGTVTRGAWLTADSVGRAVAAAPSAGVNNQVIGKALVSAVIGDVGPALLSPHQIQGA